MKICIYGAGAIGGYLGVQFARAGADVKLVARGAHLAAMRANGLKLPIGGEERVSLVQEMWRLTQTQRQRSMPCWHLLHNAQVWRGCTASIVRSRRKRR